jgi:phage terminase large subunit-like protein
MEPGTVSKITAKTFAKYAVDPEAFRADLLIDVDGLVRRLGDVLDDWQAADFAALDPALKKCNGRSKESAKNRVYLERGRGHSKTTDIAISCVWAMAFAARPIRGYAFAADKDQAALLKDAMATIVRLNPWLSDILDVQKNLVLNIAAGHPGRNSQLNISTSDVASSYGILPDFIVADELVHWEGDGSLWYSLISSAAKRSNCLLFVITNAGFCESWQWKVREAARTDDAWIFSRLEGAVASWLSEDRLNEQRRMLPLIAFMRLWGNQWSTGGGDALTQEDIDAAFLDRLEPMEHGDGDMVFVAGVDLGLTRDCSAVVVLGVPKGGRSGRVRLAHNRLWRPVLGRKINLLEIEKHILDLDERFDLATVAFDPWQMEHLAQRLEADSEHRRRNARRLAMQNAKPWLKEIPPTASNLRAQATLIIESFNDRRILCYDCPPLRYDLQKLRVEEKSYGIRLTSPRDAEGHGDTFSAFAIALLCAHEHAGKKQVVAGASGSQENHADAFMRAQAEYEAEMNFLVSHGSDHQEGFRDWARSMGRGRF